MEGLDQCAKPIKLKFSVIWFPMLKYLLQNEETLASYKDYEV